MHVCKNLLKHEQDIVPFEAIDSGYGNEERGREVGAMSRVTQIKARTFPFRVDLFPFSASVFLFFSSRVPSYCEQPLSLQITRASITFKMKYILALPLLASSALAHFTLSYPEWRGDSFADGADQWIFPCANVSQENAERTLWPLNGGSVGLELGHAWTYYSINLGLGNEVASFNITLTPELHNATGNGTLCIPKVTLPTGLVQEGQNATLQVVNFGASGSALYNVSTVRQTEAAQTNKRTIVR